MNPKFYTGQGRTKVAVTPQPWVVDCILVGICIFLPNLGLAIHYGNPARDAAIAAGFFARLRASYAELSTYDYLEWCSINILILGLLLAMRQWLVRPLSRISQHLKAVRTTYNMGGEEGDFSILNVWHIASDVGRFAGFALEYYRRYQEVSLALEQSHHVINRFAMEQETILNSTNREIATQYRSVLSYANYLELQIVNNKLDPTLRYDLDDICESSFNLKLIAG